LEMSETKEEKHISLSSTKQDSDFVKTIPVDSEDQIKFGDDTSGQLDTSSVASADERSTPNADESQCHFPWIESVLNSTLMCSSKKPKEIDKDDQITMEEMQEDIQKMKMKLAKGGHRRRKRKRKKKDKQAKEYAHMNLPEVDLEKFKEQMLTGFLVKKHGRDGFVKLRHLKCDPDFTELLWVRPASMDRCLTPRQRKQKNKHRVSMREIQEVRAASEIDRINPKYLGTEVLRRSLDPTMTKRCFSLVWEERTLDLEFADVYTCLHVYSGLRKLIKWVKGVQDADLPDNQRILLLEPLLPDL